MSTCRLMKICQRTASLTPNGRSTVKPASSLDSVLHQVNCGSKTSPRHLAQLSGTHQLNRKLSIVTRRVCAAHNVTNGRQSCPAQRQGRPSKFIHLQLHSSMAMMIHSIDLSLTAMLTTNVKHAPWERGYPDRPQYQQHLHLCATRRQN